jgi:hypothetical protein
VLVGVLVGVGVFVQQAPEYTKPMSLIWTVSFPEAVLPSLKSISLKVDMLMPVKALKGMSTSCQALVMTPPET